MKRHGHLLKGWTQSFYATRYTGVGLRTVYTLLMGIVVLFTALGIAHSQERLQISFKGKATLSISGDLPSCGDFVGCPYEHDYCSEFWNLCEGQRIRTVVVSGSYLTLGGGYAGLEYSSGASLVADLNFLFAYRAPSLRIEGYQYTPKKELGFLYFVDGVRAATLAAAGAVCIRYQPYGCCASGSASASASALVESSMVRASVSSSASASCWCENADFCEDCTSDGRSSLQCDPNPCGSGRRGQQGHKVVFEGESSQKVHTEQLRGEFSLNGSSSPECASGASLAFVQALSGVVVQSAPHPLGVPAIGENAYVWSASSPAMLTLPASALGYTWGWEPELSWMAERTHFVVKPDIESEDTKPGYQVVARGRELVAQSLDERGALWDGLVYRRKYLPPKNSDFGLKKVYFEVDGAVDYAEVEVFYPAEGSNHPSDSSLGYRIHLERLEDPSCPRCEYQCAFGETIEVPNWFYYYNQVYFPTKVVYGGSSPIGSGTRGLFCGNSPQVIFVFDPASPCWGEEAIPLFWLGDQDTDMCDGTPTRRLVEFSGEYFYVRGILRYISIVSHEHMHQQLWWRSIDRGCCSDPALDSDGDGLTDAYECAVGLNPYNKYTTRGIHDAEVPAYIYSYDQVLRNYLKWKEDWASCGINYSHPQVIIRYDNPHHMNRYIRTLGGDSR